MRCDLYSILWCVLAVLLALDMARQLRRRP